MSRPNFGPLIISHFKGQWIVLKGCYRIGLSQGRRDNLEAFFMPFQRHVNFTNTSCTANEVFLTLYAVLPIFCNNSVLVAYHHTFGTYSKIRALSFEPANIFYNQKNKDMHAPVLTHINMFIYIFVLASFFTRRFMHYDSTLKSQLWLWGFSKYGLYNSFI